MTSEIICVGTELLTGDTVNTNASYVSKRLMELGAGPVWQSVVGDNRERLTEAVGTALRRSDVIILTGGLGPTEDDLTKETAASLLRLPLYEDKASMDAIASFFAATGREMPEINRKQALIPLGAVVLENDIGTAPGVLFDFPLLRDQGRFYSRYRAVYMALLPGPPREMARMLDEKLMPYLRERVKGTALVSHYLTVFGTGESRAASLVGELQEGANPTVSPYVKNGSVRFRVTASAATEKAAEALTAPVLEEMKKRLGDSVVGVDIVSIADVAVNLLKKYNATVALAESCTGGLIAKKITDISGASDVFHMGAVTYVNEIKEMLLSVSHETLEAHGAVSKETAAEMARGAALKADADYALSVTGLAGPSGGTEETPVGTVFIGVHSKKSGTAVLKKRFGHGKADEREFIRELAAETALFELVKLIRKENNV